MLAVMEPRRERWVLVPRCLQGRPYTSREFSAPEAELRSGFSRCLADLMSHSTSDLVGIRICLIEIPRLRIAAIKNIAATE